jgi:prephenate dehydrogenase
MTRSEPSPGYSTISIVGLGLIGGSLALALRRSGFTGRILGVSRKETCAEASRLGAVDEGFAYEEIVEAACRSDLVVLASPIGVIIEHLRILGASGSRLSPGLVVTDVGSTKREILRAARESLPRGALFIGGHPLAGSEQRGIQAADPFLFQNAYYVLTPAPGVPAEAAARLGSFLGGTGARVVVLTAEDHDRIAATISHLPQLLAVSLVRFLDDLEENREHGLRLAAGGFRDMTRIASSSYSVWRDILATNRDVVSRVLERFLERTRRSLEALEPGALEEEFESAARTRAEIPRDTKGFLHRLWDVLVVVEDRPGMIAEIAAPLSARGINIKDIEVLKVREGEAGTLRLAFSSQEEARAAIRELSSAGIEARLRE